MMMMMMMNLHPRGPHQSQARIDPYWRALQLVPLVIVWVERLYAYQLLARKFLVMYLESRCGERRASSSSRRCCPTWPKVFLSSFQERWCSFEADGSIMFYGVKMANDLKKLFASSLQKVTSLGHQPLALRPDAVQRQFHTCKLTWEISRTWTWSCSCQIWMDKGCRYRSNTYVWESLIQVGHQLSSSQISHTHSNWLLTGRC